METFGPIFIEKILNSSFPAFPKKINRGVRIAYTTKNAFYKFFLPEKIRKVSFLQL